MSDSPWWLDEWCKENGWTDPTWVDEPDQWLGGRWWAFPPHGVMPLPLDPFGMNEAFKALDQVFFAFEQSVDQALEQVEVRFEPLVLQFEDTCAQVVQAWGLESLFVDDDRD